MLVVKRNQECLGSGDSMHASVKLKEIDGVQYRDWVLRFNSIQHGTTYQSQGGRESPAAEWRRFRRGLCMATRSRWSDLLVNSGNRRDSFLHLMRGAEMEALGAQVPGRTIQGRSVMHPDVLGDTRHTRVFAGRCRSERARGTAKGTVVGIEGCKGSREPGTPRKRITTRYAE